MNAVGEAVAQIVLQLQRRVIDDLPVTEGDSNYITGRQAGLQRAVNLCEMVVTMTTSPKDAHSTPNPLLLTTFKTDLIGFAFTA